VRAKQEFIHRNAVYLQINFQRLSRNNALIINSRGRPVLKVTVLDLKAAWFAHQGTVTDGYLMTSVIEYNET